MPPAKAEMVYATAHGIRKALGLPPSKDDTITLPPQAFYGVFLVYNLFIIRGCSHVSFLDVGVVGAGRCSVTCFGTKLVGLLQLANTEILERPKFRGLYG